MRGDSLSNALSSSMKVVLAGQLDNKQAQDEQTIDKN